MDETCHLLNDDSRYMVIGALACPKSKTYEITNNINNMPFYYKNHHVFDETLNGPITACL